MEVKETMAIMEVLDKVEKEILGVAVAAPDITAAAVAMAQAVVAAPAI